MSDAPKLLARRTKHLAPMPRRTMPFVPSYVLYPEPSALKLHLLATRHSWRSHPENVA